MMIVPIVIAFSLIVIASTSPKSRAPCPSRCRSCQNNVAECGKRSLTAPPRIYPQGTKTINLDGNHIRVIAEKTFENLASLEVLKISGNKIVALRNDAFSPFPNLVTLDLVDNRISRISKRVFKNLDKLRTLSLNRNKIESLEGFFQFVPNLFQLNLANNRITTIGQNDISPLTRLHYLDLRNNLLSSIPGQAFKNLQNLRYLFLNNNPLVITPSFEFGSAVLQLVDLSHCDLKKVPGPFPSSVTDLRLGHNKIMQVNHTDLLTITDLQLLTLNDNDLHYLADGSLNHLTQLREVWLRKNQLVYIPRNLPDTVRKVYVDSNNIQQIETGLFSNMSHMDYLTVENNQIRKIQPKTFSGLRFLNALNFQGNQIETLEKDTFVDLGSLSTILLSNNPLKKIESGAFRNLGNLTQLFMCYIGEEDFELEGNFLPEMLRLQKLRLMNSPGLVDDLMVILNDSAASPIPLKKLNELDLSYNNLKWVSPRIREVFPNLLSIPLDGNPLRCSKNLKWLRDWMISSKVSFHNFNEIFCETPLRLKNRPIISIEDNEWAAENEADSGVSGIPAVVEGSATSGSELTDQAQQDAAASKIQLIREREDGQGMAKKSRDGKKQSKDTAKEDDKETVKEEGKEMVKEEGKETGKKQDKDTGKEQGKETGKGKGKGQKGNKQEKKRKGDKKGKDKTSRVKKN